MLRIPSVPKFFVAVSVLFIMLSALLASPARAATWAGVTTDWNTGLNWSPIAVPNSLATPVFFNDASARVVNISSSVSVQSITFNTPSFSYTLTSNANQTLTVQNSITMSASSTGTENINLASVSTGSLLYPSGATFSIINNSVNGSISIGSTTVIGTPGNTGITFGGNGFISFSGSFAASPNNVVGPLTKIGAGTFNFGGSGANFSGNIVVAGGTLNLDYTTNSATKTIGGLVLSGGTLQAVINNSPITQSFTSTTVTSGHTDVKAFGNSSVTLNLSTISHSLGGTVDFNPSGANPSFAMQTSSVNVNNIIGGYATVNGGAGWAAVSGVVVAPLGGYNTNIYTSGANTDITANSNQSGITTNSLRFNTGNLTLGLSGTNTLQSGGVLVTQNATAATISGGTLTASSSGELFFHVYSNGGLTVNSLISSSTGLTKTGPGNLTLGSSNIGLTGPVNINRGNLTITNAAAVGSASQINFNDATLANTFGGIQQFVVDLGSGTNATLNPAIRVSAAGGSDIGTYFTTGASLNSTITLAGVISSNNGLNTPIRFTGNAQNISGFNLTAVNTFTGNIDLFQGFLGINSDAALGNAANVLSLNVGGDTGGLVFLNSGINVVHNVTMTLQTRILSNNADTNTISGVISGPAALVKDGAGTLILSNAANTYSGGTIVNNGTLSLGSTGKLASGTDLTVQLGGTFTPGTTSGIVLNNVTLNSGTFRISSGAPLLQISQLTSTFGGALNFTGAGAVNFEVSNSITVSQNATWLSLANFAVLDANNGSSDVTFNISPGATLNNGLALTTTSGFGFRITGGGTLYQNADATNVLDMAAPITVAGNSTFRVTDITTAGKGNIGSSGVTLDGGNFSYGGASASTSHSFGVTINGGGFAVESAATTMTITGSVFGPGALTKSGPGTLILNNVGNSFNNVTINGGTLSVPNDNSLGFATGSVTVNPGGTMLFSNSATTQRNFTLNSGTLQVTSGQTLTLSTSSVAGGFLRGAVNLINGTSLTGVTTFNSTTLNQSNASTFTNVTNGGTLNSTAALTYNAGINETSGIINVNSTLATSDFTNNGVINVAPGASITNSNSNLFLGGGARLFIGTKNNPTGSLTLLNSTTLEVNGALLVNDGTITGTTDVNYGGTAQGIGTYGVVNVSFGGVFQPGFASAGVINNGASVSQLTGSGTIDNTSTGAMTLTLTGSYSSSFSGAIQNSNGATTLSITGTSSLTLSTSALPGGGNTVNAYTGGTNISAGGTLIIAASGALPNSQAIHNDGAFTVNAKSVAGNISGLGNTTIGDNATLTLGSNSGASQQRSLTFHPGAQLDLANNPLVIQPVNGAAKSSAITQLANAINSGHNGTDWTGPGITSSLAQAHPINFGSFAVGLYDNNAFFQPFANLNGVPADALSLIVAPTYNGDADLDGKVDILDLTVVANHWQTSQPTWATGDIVLDGFVDILDLTAVANNWQAGVPPGFSSNLSFADALAQFSQFNGLSVPEPASVALLAAAFLFGTRRRGR